MSMVKEDTAGFGSRAAKYADVISAPPASRRNEGLMHRDGGGTNAEAS